MKIQIHGNCTQFVTKLPTYGHEVYMMICSKSSMFHILYKCKLNQYGYYKTLGKYDFKLTYQTWLVLEISDSNTELRNYNN